MRALPCAVLLAAVAAPAWPSASYAQDVVEEVVRPMVGPGLLTLNRAQARMDEGRIREARVELMQWWDAFSVDGSDGELQRALWLRGLLTVDPRIAEVDFRRLVLEFPEGSYTGQARLRLAQSAHAQGDLEAAKEHFVALERDFPNSGLRLAARAWLDRYAPGTARVREVPLQRADPDTVTMPSAVATVELGRFRDAKVAGELMERALSAGLESHVVQMNDGSHSVRMGRFDTPETARAARSQARALGFPARLVPLTP